MTTQLDVPVPLPSEDVIISAPMSYTGSAQRIMRLRRRAQSAGQLTAITTAAVALVILAWIFVTCWYAMWGILLVPYRLQRRGARKRKAEALRHRELLATIQSSASIRAREQPRNGDERVGDAEREQTLEELRQHLLAGRLTTDEFDQRVGAAQTAKTRNDIDAVTWDLPRQQALPRAPSI